MTGAWQSLYIPVTDPAAIAEALDGVLVELGYKPYDPFPGGKGAMLAALWKQRARHFVAPTAEGWTRVLVAEAAPAAYPALAAALGVPVLDVYLDDSQGSLTVWPADGGGEPVKPVVDGLAAWLRPDRTRDDLERALVGDAPVPLLEDDGPQLMAIPLPEDAAALSEQVDPAQAEQMLNRLSGSLFGKLGGGDAARQGAAQMLNSPVQRWNTDEGRRLRAVLACLTLPAGWAQPELPDIQAAYQVARARANNPASGHLPGDDAALARVPTALTYRPVYAGQR